MSFASLTPVLRKNRHLGPTFAPESWVKELSVELDFEKVEAMTIHLRVARKVYDFCFLTDVCRNVRLICMSLLQVMHIFSQSPTLY